MANDARHRVRLRLAGETHARHLRRAVRPAHLRNLCSMPEGARRIESRAVAFGVHGPFGKGVVGFFPQVERLLVTFPATRRAAVLREHRPLVFRQRRPGRRVAGESGGFLRPAPEQPPACEDDGDPDTRQCQPACSVPGMIPMSGQRRRGLRSSFARFGHDA